MKRSHRSAHRSIWIVLTILIAAGLSAALINRKPQKQKKSDAGHAIHVLASEKAKGNTETLL